MQAETDVLIISFRDIIKFLKCLINNLKLMLILLPKFIK